jgi:hypothetical protein
MLKIVRVWFESDKIFIELNDQRVIGTPICWYKNLSKGTIEQQKNFEIRETYIHWPELDEDLSAEGFLRFEPSLV